MGKSQITDKGVGYMVGGSFISDMAQLWNNRIESHGAALAQSDKISKGERLLNSNINALMRSQNSDLKTIAKSFEATHSEIVGDVSMLSYRHGFQDGVRMIIQSIMG